MELRPDEITVYYTYKSQGWSPMVAVGYKSGTITFSADAGHTYLVTTSYCQVNVMDQTAGVQLASNKIDQGLCF